MPQANHGFSESVPHSIHLGISPPPLFPKWSWELTPSTSLRSRMSGRTLSLHIPVPWLPSGSRALAHPPQWVGHANPSASCFIRRFHIKFSGEVNTQYFSCAKIVRSFLVRSVTPPPANRLFPEIFLFFSCLQKKSISGILFARQSPADLLGHRKN